MKKIRLITVLSLVFALVSVSFTFAEIVGASASDGWVEVGGRWKYEKDGVAKVSTWETIKKGTNDYGMYYFDDEGFMVTGVWKIDNQYYSFNSDGTTNSKKSIIIDGESFPTVNKGLIEEYPSSCAQDSFKGTLVTVDGMRRFMIDGVPLTNSWRLVYDNNQLSWFYFGEDGFALTGLNELPDKNFYYFGNDGAAVSHKESVKILADYDSETIAKGQVVSLPNGFNLEDYKRERKEMKESLAAESRAKTEEAANLRAFNAQFNTTLSAEEQARLDQEKQNQIAAAEAEKAHKAASAITMIGKSKDKITVESERGGKVTLSYVYPVLTGANSDVLNNAIKSNLGNLLYVEVEDKYATTSTKISKSVTNVSVSHDLNSHLVVMSFSGDLYFTVYLDTNSLEMWVGN